MHTWRQDNSDSRAQEQGHTLSTKHLHVRHTLLGITRFNALGQGQYWSRLWIMHAALAHPLSHNLNYYWPRPHALNHKSLISVIYR